MSTVNMGMKQPTTNATTSDTKLIDTISLKSLPVLLFCYKNLSICYAMKNEALIGQFLIHYFFLKVHF